MATAPDPTSPSASDLSPALRQLLAEREAEAIELPQAIRRGARAALRDGCLVLLILLATAWPLWRLAGSDLAGAAGRADPVACAPSPADPAPAPSLSPPVGACPARSPIR